MIHIPQILYKPPGGSLFSSSTFEGEGLIWGGSFNLVKIVVSAPWKELKYKAQEQEFGAHAMQPRIKNRAELLTSEYTIPDQFKWSFTVVID